MFGNLEFFVLFSTFRDHIKSSALKGEHGEELTEMMSEEPHNVPLNTFLHFMGPETAEKIVKNTNKHMAYYEKTHFTDEQMRANNNRHKYRPFDNFDLYEFMGVLQRRGFYI